MQEDSCSASVVVSCSYVKCWKADLPFRAVVDEQRHDVFMALLEGHSEGREAILRDSTDDGGEEVRRENKML